MTGDEPRVVAVWMSPADLAWVRRQCAEAVAGLVECVYLPRKQAIRWMADGTYQTLALEYDEVAK